MKINDTVPTLMPKSWWSDSFLHDLGTLCRHLSVGCVIYICKTKWFDTFSGTSGDGKSATDEPMLGDSPNAGPVARSTESDKRPEEDEEVTATAERSNPKKTALALSLHGVGRSTSQSPSSSSSTQSSTSSPSSSPSPSPSSSPSPSPSSSPSTSTRFSYDWVLFMCAAVLVVCFQFWECDATRERISFSV